MTVLFDRFEDDPVTVARRLLGQRIVRTLDGERLAGTIVEVEAYLGAMDRAAHTFGNRRTARNEAMYLPGGHAYVYFTYGMHFCLNVVCGAVDEGVAVLIRAIEPTEGIETMRARRAARGGRGRRRDWPVGALCSGPAKLTQALGIDRDLDGTPLDGTGPLAIERRRQRRLPDRCILTTPRIGVSYAGAWADRPLRFCVAGSPFLSRPVAVGI